MTTSSTQADPQPRDLRLSDAWDALGSPSVKIVSTDVFDTLIWRTVPEPVDAFPLIAMRLRERGQLAPMLEPRAFGNLRRSAERSVRQARAARLAQTEVTLGEIYEQLPPWVFAGAIAPGEAALVELEVERELLVPDLDIVDLLDAAQRAGKRIVAVSDTYFSAGQLRELLDQPVLSRLQFDAVFTSSDHRTNKSGGLYEIVLRALGAEGQEVLHVGDNPEADQHLPGLAKIRTVAFERRPEPFAGVDVKEARFRPALAEDVSDQAVAGGLTAARSKVLFRTELQHIPTALQPHWKYGATVLGPVLAAFADWVLDESERRGVARVGCLMREGEFLADLIGRAALYRDSDVSAEPLWLNRAVCLRAAIVRADENDLAPFFAGRSPITVEALMRRLGLGMSALPGWASHAQTTFDDPVVRQNLLDSIAADDAVRSAILTGARTQRERVARLVDGFAGPAPDPIMVADLGWGATIQRLLGEVLHEAGAPRGSIGLYLLTHEGAAEQILTGIEVHGFLGDFGIPEDPVKLIMRSPELLEQVCMPEHGSQLGLDEGLRPVCENNLLPPLQRVEADAVRKGIFAFQREWARYRAALPGRLPSLATAKRLLRPILLRSVVAPTAEEVSIFGAWLHDENRGSDRVDQVLDPADLERVRYMDPDQARRLPVDQLYWPFGLAARIDEHWADLMSAAAAGQVPWEALSAPLDTGAFCITAAGVGFDPGGAVRAQPHRNRFGLSAVTATLRASQLSELVLRPSESPSVLRIDRISLRCWRQGDAEPLLVVLDGPDGLARLRHVNCFVLQPNVVIAHGSDAELRLPLAEVTPRIVFRVDVEVAFAALAISQVLPGEQRFGNLEEAAERLAAAEKEVRYMRSTSIWRYTAPLRTIKRRLS